MDSLYDRKKYFLRKPVEHHLRNLATALEEMAKQEDFPKEVRVAYGVTGEKLREITTRIIRDDNHAITEMNRIESLVESWKEIYDKISNSTKTN